MGNKQNLLIGASLSLLSFFCLASTTALVKIINGRIDVFQILLLQNAFGLAIIFLICLFKQKSISFYKSDHYGLLFLRSLAGFSSFYLVFIAVKYLSLVNTTLLLNTSPFFIPFMLLVCFKETIKHRLWFGIVPGFLGIAIILHPGSAIFQWDAIFPLLAGMCVAIIFISLGRLHHHKEPMLRILLYLFLFATLLSLPFGASHWQNPSAKEGILLVLIALTSFLAQTTVTLSLRYGSPKALAPICYSSVIFAIVFDWLIWNDIPSWTSVIGIILVIAGGITAIRIESKSMKANK